MRCNKERGFTLVELMVVIVLIGLLAGTVTVAVWPVLFKGKKSQAETQLNVFKEALEMYRISNNRYPDALEMLAQPDPDHDFPNGYLEGTSELPLDPWDEEYVYTGSADAYEIYSRGPDQQDNTDDDIRVSSGGGGAR